MDLIKVAEEAFATGKQHPSFKAGDTVTVAYKIIPALPWCRYQDQRSSGEEAFHCSQDVGYRWCRAYLPSGVTQH